MDANQEWMCLMRWHSQERLAISVFNGFEEPIDHTDYEGYSILRNQAAYHWPWANRSTARYPWWTHQTQCAYIWQPDILRLGGVEAWRNSRHCRIHITYHLCCRIDTKDYDVPLLSTIANGAGWSHSTEPADWIIPCSLWTVCCRKTNRDGALILKMNFLRHCNIIWCNGLHFFIQHSCASPPYNLWRAGHNLKGLSFTGILSFKQWRREFIYRVVAFYSLFTYSPLTGRIGRQNPRSHSHCCVYNREPYEDPLVSNIVRDVSWQQLIWLCQYQWCSKTTRKNQAVIMDLNGEWDFAFALKPGDEPAIL